MLEVQVTVTKKKTNMRMLQYQDTKPSCMTINKARDEKQGAESPHTHPHVFSSFPGCQLPTKQNATVAGTLASDLFFTWFKRASLASRRKYILSSKKEGKTPGAN